jgi:hypothetical protein
MVIGEFQRLFINSFSSWVCLFFVVTIFAGFSMIFFVVIEKYVPHWVDANNETLLSTAAKIISANYGVLLGFVVVILWQAFNVAEKVTQKEATALALITYESAHLPNPIQGAILADVKLYVQAVTRKEWPQMAQGTVPTKGQEILAGIFLVLKKYDPQTELHKTLRDQILRNLHHVIEQRKERLDAVQSVLTEPLRIILVIGFFIVSFFISLLSNENQKIHRLSVLLVGMVIAFNLAIAINLDYPFSGSLSVTSEPYTQGILAQFK